MISTVSGASQSFTVYSGQHKMVESRYRHVNLVYCKACQQASCNKLVNNSCFPENTAYKNRIHNIVVCKRVFIFGEAAFYFSHLVLLQVLYPFPDREALLIQSQACSSQIYRMQFLRVCGPSTTSLPSISAENIPLFFFTDLKLSAAASYVHRYPQTALPWYL